MHHVAGGWFNRPVRHIIELLLHLAWSQARQQDKNRQSASYNFKCWLQVWDAKARSGKRYLTDDRV